MRRFMFDGHDKGVNLSVYYDSESHEFTVIGEKEEHKLEKSFIANHEPTFGIDVADLRLIDTTTDQLLKEFIFL